MDPKRFDDLTRALASGVPRRRFIAMIGATVAGSALGGMWPGRAVLAVGPPCLGCSVPGAFICGTVIYPQSAFAECIDACRSNPRVCFCQSCSPACPPGLNDCNGVCWDCSCDRVCGTTCCSPFLPHCVNGACSASVGKSTAVAYTGNTTTDFHDAATLAATLVDTSVSPAVPVPYAPLPFTLGPQPSPPPPYRS